jgi:hypothetical protein
MIDGEKINISHTMTQKSLPRIITKAAQTYMYMRAAFIWAEKSRRGVRVRLCNAQWAVSSLAPGSRSINFAVEFGGENRAIYLFPRPVAAEAGRELCQGMRMHGNALVFRLYSALCVSVQTSHAAI